MADMLSQQEQPWQAGPEELPFTTHLVNRHGDRHLGFNDDDGRFSRLWRHTSPEPLHTGDAVLLRPSDIDRIIHGYRRPTPTNAQSAPAATAR